MTVTLPLAAVALVLLWNRPTNPSRLALLAKDQTSPHSQQQRATAIRLATPALFVLGAWLVGMSMLTSVAAAGAIGVGLEARRRSRSNELLLARAEALPEVVELVTLGLGAGGTVMLGLELVESVGPAPVRSAVGAAIRRSRSGERRRVALQQLVVDLGPSYQPFVDILISGERNGAALGDVLDRLGAEATAAKTRQAQERARRTPVKLLAPLVLCGLPAVLIGTVVPLVFLALQSVELPVR